MLVTIGPSGSGKTTWVDALCEKSPQYVKVERDEIRQIIGEAVGVAPYSKDWGDKHEKSVTENQKKWVIDTYKDDKIPIISDTNLREDTRKMFCEIAKQFNDEVDFVHFFSSREELHRRNNARADSVPSDVIDNHYRRHVELAPFNPDVKYTVGSWHDNQPVLATKSRILVDSNAPKPDAYCFDLDGTLALRKNRSPFDWNRVHEDMTNEPVAITLAALRDFGMKIILVSGRDESCRDLTEWWLNHFGIPYDQLFMRESGDKMKDSVVKHDLYINHIYPNYDVQAVFDDRDQVVNMWRAMGLPCFQVQEGDF